MSKYVVKKEIFAEKVAERPLPNSMKAEKETLLKKKQNILFPTTSPTN